MAKAGRRYSLVMYTHMINRWWPAVLTLGLGLLALAWVLQWWGFEAWRWFTLGSVGLFVLVVALFMFTLRKSAYVQLFPDHLRLVTPFLRINISYKRFRRTSSATLGALFPPNSISSWRREIIAPLARMTALVIELNGYPISQQVLRFFLSPFFFRALQQTAESSRTGEKMLNTALESMRDSIRDEVQAASYPLNLALTETQGSLNIDQRQALEAVQAALQRLNRVAEKTVPPSLNGKKK